MDQVERAFNGRYREVNRETQQWYTYNHLVPEPRPGMVRSCTLPSAGRSRSDKSAAWPGLTFPSILQLSPITLVSNVSYTPHHSCSKAFLLIYRQSVLLLLSDCFVAAKSNKKLINHCPAARYLSQYLSFCVSD